MRHTQHIPKDHRYETHLLISARSGCTAVVLWRPSMGIQQVLRGPRCALRLDPKHSTAAVITTFGAREASPRLPPLPLRNGELFLLLHCCRWSSRVAKATFWCALAQRSLSLFRILQLCRNIQKNVLGGQQFVADVTLFCYRYGDG